MFYFKLALWYLISLVARILFYSRLYFCKWFNYPVLPMNFYFDEFSIYWLYFLAFFYEEGNYLSILPLDKDDLLELKGFRKFLKNYPFDLVNFIKIKSYEREILKQNYNSFKHEFKLSQLWINFSKIFIVFFNDSNSFLKFLFFRNYTLKNFFLSFFINTFHDHIYTNPTLKDFIYNDYILTLNLMFFKKKNYFNIINRCTRIDLFVVNEILNKNKRVVPVNNNPHLELHQSYLIKFKKAKKAKFIKFFKLYDAFWATSYISLYNVYLVLQNEFYKIKPFKRIFFLKNFPVKINNAYNNFLNLYWPVKNQNGLFSKFVDLNFNKNNTIFFLRKIRIFNKGRYSRNRQLYRTGVYMCLWINIIFVYFYIFAFYRFTFNFGFMWFGIGLFILSMTFSRAARYRFYNFKNFIVEFYNFILWAAFFLEDFLRLLKKPILNWFNFFKNSYKLSFFFNKD